MLLKLYHPLSGNEICYYLLLKLQLSEKELDKVKSILSRNGKYQLIEKSELEEGTEIGPRFNFTSIWSYTLTSLLESLGIHSIVRIEYSIKYPREIVIPEYDSMLFQIYQSDTVEKNLLLQTDVVNDVVYEVDIETYNREEQLGFSQEDIEYYQKMYRDLGRKPTQIELYDLSQCNSEHARHWFFKGKLGKEKETLFEKIKSCYDPRIHQRSLVSFYDNASVVKGSFANMLITHSTLQYHEILKKIHFSYKAETHNFPTGISPFPGAGTGAGGRIRDILCVGKGGDIIAGTAGYCVGDIWSQSKVDYDMVCKTPIQILIEASNGASDYGNKIGEPLIQGFTRSFRADYTDNYESPRRIEYLKPIMFSGGIGKVLESNLDKLPPRAEQVVFRLGGPAYRIGMGGGSASSRTQDSKNMEQDFQAVQRGDPLMANKIVKFLRKVLPFKNVITAIHDQGSGGMANVTREICEPLGAEIYLDRVLLGDHTLTSLEKWVAEYQEQVSFLSSEENLHFLQDIARRENISLVPVGKINQSGNLVVYRNEDDLQKLVNLPTEMPSFQKKFPLKIPSNKPWKVNTSELLSSESHLHQRIKALFKLVDVGSKQFLTNKVDRSVGGLVVQQQCVGPYHLPLSNFSAVKNSFESQLFLVSAIGEQPLKGLDNNMSWMVYHTVGEMITNILWAKIGSLRNINTVANWMWPSTQPEDAYLINEAVDTLKICSQKLGFSINGGKDSLSMKVKHHWNDIKAPGTLTLSGYATASNHHFLLTPDLKSFDSTLILLRPEETRGILGQTAYSRISQVTDRELKNWNLEKALYGLKRLYNFIQEINSGYLVSGHDISDGGLFTCLSEMAFSSIFGIDLDIKTELSLEEYLFNEEVGIVIEVKTHNLPRILEIISKYQLYYDVLGQTKSEREVTIKFNKELVFDETNDNIRFWWQNTSYLLEKKQANPRCIDEEVINCYHLDKNRDFITEDIYKILRYNNFISPKFSSHKPIVAILRGEGSNGEVEMANVFYQVGFDVYNIIPSDIAEGKLNLRKCRGLVFVGGFTYSDVLGSAYGWYYRLMNDPIIKQELDHFYHREDTFSLGVCNGCQLMSLLGWIPGGVKLEPNISQRFESRWSQVKIIENHSIFLRGLEGLVFGIYSAHGEGKIELEEEMEDSLYPIRYVDLDNEITEKYPFNPNGSAKGRACAVSEDGRHLALMPHPERTVQGYQLPYPYPCRYTPWFLMFKNVYEWCV